METHPAAGYAAGAVSTVPATDIDGDERSVALADAGADQVSFPSRITVREPVSGTSGDANGNVFSLNGNRVALRGAANGVYIFRKGGTVTRVMVIR